MARCTFAARVAGPRLAAVVAVFVLSLGSFAGTAGSLAGAAEGPLGVSPQGPDIAADSFVDAKLGVEDADDRLHSSAAPRDIADAGESWYAEPAPAAADPAEEPAYQEPAPEQAAWEEPAYEQAAPEAPAWDEPVSDASPEQPAEPPAPEEPAYEEPVWEEPVYEEPVYEEPAVTWYSAVASAYDPNCNGGTATSSGIPLDWYTPTVASPWLPLGCYVEISYGGMSVVAQVTDRGPFVGGRDLDLSPGVFYAFGFGSADSWGVRSVSYRVL